MMHEIKQSRIGMREYSLGLLQGAAIGYCIPQFDAETFREEMLQSVAYISLPAVILTYINHIISDNWLTAVNRGSLAFSAGSFSGIALMEFLRRYNS
jgi:hypothetical protein